MRLREYGRRLDGGHDRWMRDDVTVTVLGDAPDRPDAPRAAVFGRIGADAFCVVVDDDGKLEYLLDRGTAGAEFDLDLMRRDLGVLARHALERLVDDPADRLWNGLFRAGVWAATTPLATTFTDGTRHVAAFSCADAVPGEPAAEPVSLVARIPADRPLTAALARAIADPATLRDLDVPVPSTLTAAGVTAALVGTDIEADVTIEEIAVSGVWPADGSPLAGLPPDGLLCWHDLDWYLLAGSRRLRAS